LRWFISSVTDEMLPHRRAVAQAMRYLREHRRFDIVPFRMEEDYPTPSSRPEVNYLNELDQSDAMVLVLGKYYGRKSPQDGLSATHRELLHAVETGKLIVLFYDANTDEYEPDEQEFLHVAFSHAQGYPFDGTFQNLETIVQRVLEGLYRGSVERNPIVAHMDGIGFAERNGLPHIAVFSTKISAPISIEEHWNMRWTSICRGCRWSICT